MRISALPLDLRDRLRHVVDLHGDRVAAERLGIDHRTLLRCLAGLRVHAGTIALVRARLDGDL